MSVEAVGRLLILAVLLHSAGATGVEMSAAATTPTRCLGVRVRVRVRVRLSCFVSPHLLGGEDCLLESRDEWRECLQLAGLSN